MESKKKEIKKNIVKAVNKVREINPMAGSITNTVTINFVANAQLAVGGSAAMVYLPDEGEDLARLGDAMYINVGTMFPVYEETLEHVARILFEIGKPWVLDPVAIGIGDLRTKVLKEFKNYKPNIIRGNASEIIALAGLWELDGGRRNSKVRGVDSTNLVGEAKNAAIELAKYTGGAVAVSGAIDLVTDGKLLVYSKGGSHFMEKITGAGCSLGGVMGIYLTVTDPFTAAIVGTQIYNLAGRLAEMRSQGTGSFHVHFLDELYKASGQDIANNYFEIKEV
ncbi:MAG: hydroxyethylthiazole kinase [Epulopiscium sp.]|nr:hydroxyethylthiazole kinase [Candidatus Epulonipiscium sp.]